MADPVTPTPPRVTCITHGVFELPTSTGEPIIFTVPAGYMLYFGEIAPTASVGNPGDWYIFTSSSTSGVYRKINTTTWTLITTLGGGGGGGGTGTVTSVDATVPGFLSVTGGPITGSGTLTIDYSGTPLPVANGGTGTATPGLIDGSGIVVTGSWPNQTITASETPITSVASISKDVTQAHSYSVGDVVYDNAGSWVKAKADDISTTILIGVISEVPDANHFTVVLSGEITLSGLTQGVYYLSAATAGLLTQTPPVGLTQFLAPVLYASTGTLAYVIQSFPSSLATVDIEDGGTGGVTEAEAWVNLNVETNVISAVDIDWSLSRSHSKTLAANTTFTFSNAIDGQEIRVYVTNTASNWTVTWPAVKWTGGTPPTQTIGVKTDFYRFSKVGSVIYGVYDQDLS